MTNRITRLGERVLGLLAVLAVLPAGGGPVLADPMPWAASYEAAQTKAKGTDKLMMVDVYTDWCGWCHKLDEDVYPQPAVVKAAAQFVPVRINAEKEGQGVATKYSVTGYPTILFLDTDGTLVGKIGGYEEADQFAADLNRIVEERRQFPLLQAKVKAARTDIPSSVQLSRLYLHRGRTTEAQALLAAVEKQGGAAQIGSLYNEMAEAQIEQGQVENGMASFKKTVALSKSTSDLVAAHIGLLRCYAGLNNTAQVKAQLKALIALPGAPTQIKKGAKAMLAQMTGPPTK